MEFPQMLYKDNLDDWAIADVEPEFKPLIAKGYRTHGDLMAELFPQAKLSTVKDNTPALTDVDVAEDFNELSTDTIDELSTDTTDVRIITDVDFDVEQTTRSDLTYNLDARGIEHKSKDNKTKLAAMLVTAIRKGE